MEENIILDEKMQEMLSLYRQFKKEIEKQEAIEKKEIFSIISSRLDSIRSLKNRIYYIGGIAIALPGFIGLEIPLPMDFKVLTSALALIITTGIGLANSGINGDFVPDIPMKDYARKLKARKQAQFWWIRITWILFALWYGFSLGKFAVSALPVWGKSLGIVLLTAFVGFLYVFITRIHSRIIGHYEGIILRLENPEAAELIGD